MTAPSSPAQQEQLYEQNILIFALKHLKFNHIEGSINKCRHNI